MFAILKSIMSVLTVIVMFFTSVIPSIFDIGGEDIAIIFTNDVHCAINEDNSFGYAGIAAFKKDAEKNHAHVTLVDSGDYIQGGPIGSLSSGTFIIDIMNKVGYDYATLGNHEFDYGMLQLSNLISQADFDILSCNINYSGNEENLLKDVKPYDIVDYGKTEVAYIGVSTPSSITSSTPKFFQDQDGNFIYTFSSDTAYEVQKYALEARTKGADYVVVLSHLGKNNEYTSFDLASETVGIDAIFDAHDHVVFEEKVKNKNGKDVIVASTGTGTAYVGKLEIAADGSLNSKLVSYDMFTERDSEVAKYVEQKDSEFNKILDRKVGTSEFALKTSDDNGVRMVRNRETTCGDFVADAYRYAADAQIGIVNGGGVRANIDAGDITYRELLAVNPYGKPICKVEVTGQMLADALEFSCRNTCPDYANDGMAIGEFGGFLQVSGLKFTLDTTIPPFLSENQDDMFTGVSGQRRVKDIMVEKDGTWVPLDLNEKYIVGGTAYVILDNGDGYTAFNGCTVISSDLSLDVDALYKYIESSGGKIDSKYASTQGRINVIEGD